MCFSSLLMMILSLCTAVLRATCSFEACILQPANAPTNRSVCRKRESFFISWPFFIVYFSLLHSQEQGQCRTCRVLLALAAQYLYQCCRSCLLFYRSLP